MSNSHCHFLFILGTGGSHPTLLHDRKHWIFFNDGFHQFTQLDLAEVLAEFEDIDRVNFDINDRVLDVDDDDNNTEADMNIAEGSIDPESNDRGKSTKLFDEMGSS